MLVIKTNISLTYYKNWNVSLVFGGTNVCVFLGFSGYCPWGELLEAPPRSGCNAGCHSPSTYNSVIYFISNRNGISVNIPRN